jgi:hypothetical protein
MLDEPVNSTSLDARGNSPGSRLTYARHTAGGVGIVAILTLGLARLNTDASILAFIAFFGIGAAVVIGFIESWGAPRSWARRDTPPSERLPDHDRRRWLIAFAVAAIGATVAIQMWFAAGTAVAGGDNTFPNGTAWFGRMFSPWAFSGVNLGGPNLLQAQFPWGVVLGLVQSVGGSADVAQRIWYTLLFAGAGLGAVALLRTLGMRPLPAICGAYVYLFNGYVLGWIGINSTYLAALTLLPAVMACILAASKGALRISVAAILLAASAPLLGFASQNPPLVAVILLPVLGCPLLAAWLGGRVALMRGLRALAIGLPLLLLASLYWIVPEALAYATLGNPAFSPASSWRFTEIRATLSNALWLNNVWSWGHPEYIPYATNYLLQPLALAKYLLPALAFAPVAFLKRDNARRRGARMNLLRISVAFTAVALVFEFLSTGTLPPGSVLFNVLYSLPGGVLLREPGRFLILSALAYSALVAVAVAAVLVVSGREMSRWRWHMSLRSARGAIARYLAPAIPLPKKRFGLPSRRAILQMAPVTVAALFIAALTPAYPLMTGAVVPGQRANLPSTQVNLPVYWQKMLDDINHEPTSGALLVLPPDDYYQMPYRFGYYGADTFIVQAIARHVIMPNPQGYLRKSPELLAAVSAAANHLTNADDAGAARIIASLQGSLVLVRGDIDPNAFLLPGRHIVSPLALSSALRASQHFELLVKQGPLELYRLTDPVPAELGIGAHFATVNTPSPDLSILSLLPAGTDLVSEAPERGLPAVFTLPDLSQWDVSPSELSARLQVPQGWTYHLADLRATTAGATLTSLAASGEDQALKVSVPLGSQNLVSNGDFSAGLWQKHAADCGGFNTGTNVIDASSVQGPDGQLALRLSASVDIACENKKLSWTSGPILLRVKFQHLVGAPPRLCVWDDGAGRCAATPQLTNGSGWQQYQAVVTPSLNATSLRLFLYSDAQTSCLEGSCTTSLTVNEFSQIQAFSLPAIPSAIVLGTPVDAGNDANLLVLRDTYSSDWQGPGDARHVVVDGLLNGWIGKSPSPQVAYGPARLLIAATAVSAATLLALVLIGGVPAGLRAWRGRRKLVAFVTGARRADGRSS